MHFFKVTFNKWNRIMFSSIILICVLYILIRRPFFCLQQSGLTNIYKSPIENYLVDSSHTLSKRKLLPDLNDYRWPQTEFAPIPSGANGSIQTLFGPKYSAGQCQVQRQLFTAFSNFMEESGLSNKWFIYGGTLLGSFRHHDNIPWDDDIDILIDNDARQILKRKFSRRYPEMYLSEGGNRDKIYAKLISPANSTDDLEGSRKLSDYSWGWPFLDLSYYVQNITHITEIAWAYGRQYQYEKTDIFPLIFRPYNKLWVPSPRNTFKVLIEMYPRSTTCVESTYSHIFERIKYGKSIDCKELAHRYPFVRRSRLFADNTEVDNEDELDWMMERLILETNSTGVELIHELLLVAPQLESRVDTYSLTLKNG